MPTRPARPQCRAEKLAGLTFTSRFRVFAGPKLVLKSWHMPRFLAIRGLTVHAIRRFSTETGPCCHTFVTLLGHRWRFRRSGSRFSRRFLGRRPTFDTPRACGSASYTTQRSATEISCWRRCSQSICRYIHYTYTIAPDRARALIFGAPMMHAASIERQMTKQRLVGGD